MRLEQDGIAPDMLSAEELATMFMPQEVRKVQRGWLDLFNNSYFSTELAEYHKDEVRVSYDLSDASAVNVFDIDGKFITKAQANGNTREAFTASDLYLFEELNGGKYAIRGLVPGLMRTNEAMPSGAVIPQSTVYDNLDSSGDEWMYVKVFGNHSGLLINLTAWEL